MRSSFCSCTPCQQTARSSFWSPSEALFPSALHLLWRPPARSKSPTMTQNVTHTVNRSLQHSAPQEVAKRSTLQHWCPPAWSNAKSIPNAKSNDGCNVPSQKSEDTRTISRAFRPPSEPIAPILLLGVVHTSIMGAAGHSVPIRKG